MVYFFSEGLSCCFYYVPRRDDDCVSSLLLIKCLGCVRIRIGTIQFNEYDQKVWQTLSQRGVL